MAEYSELPFKFLDADFNETATVKKTNYLDETK